MFGIGAASLLSLIINKIGEYLEDRQTRYTNIDKKIQEIDQYLEMLRNKRVEDLGYCITLGEKIRDLEEIILPSKNQNDYQPTIPLGWGKGKDE